MHFDGETFEPAQDEARLTSQFLRVQAVMQDGNWHSLRELAEQTGGSEPSVSARLRDLRKKRFGAHVVERARIGGGLFVYRLAK